MPFKQNAVADALSRLTLPSTAGGESAVFKVEERLVDCLPITQKEISHAARVDPVLSRVLEFGKNGWPQHVEDLRLKPFSTVVTSCQLNKIVYYGEYEWSSLQVTRRICWKNYMWVIQASSV